MNADSGPKPPLMRKDTSGQSFLVSGSAGMEGLPQVARPRELGLKGDGSPGQKDLQISTPNKRKLHHLECSGPEEDLRPVSTLSKANNQPPADAGIVVSLETSPGTAGTGSLQTNIVATPQGIAPMLGEDQPASIQTIVHLPSQSTSHWPRIPREDGLGQNQIWRRASCQANKLSPGLLHWLQQQTKTRMPKMQQRKSWLSVLPGPILH